MRTLAGALTVKQLLTLSAVSRSAREAVSRSPLSLLFSKHILGAGFGRWAQLLELVAQRCPAATALSFSSCDVDSAAVAFVRQGAAFPALTSLRLLRCYHLRAPYEVASPLPAHAAGDDAEEQAEDPEEPFDDGSPAAKGDDDAEQDDDEEQPEGLQLRELVALNLNVLDHAGFSLRQVQTLVMTGCESSMDGAQSQGLLNLLEHAAPQLRHLFLGGAKLQLYSPGRSCSVPQLELCELTFWEDDVKEQAASHLPNAKIVDLTDLKTLKNDTNDLVVSYDPSLPWECAVECRGRRGVRPLHLAAIAGDAESVAWLLSVGADFDAKDAKGCTALFRACQHGATQATQHLLEKGADYLLQNQSLETPLYIASLCGFLGCVETLLDKDSSRRHASGHVSDKDNDFAPALPGFKYFDGWSPLHAACLKGSFDIAEALLAASFNPNALNKWRQAPIHVVARGGDINLAELLYSNRGEPGGTAGAEIDAADVDGLTPAIIAKERGHEEMLAWLADKGAVVPDAEAEQAKRGKGGRRRKKKKDQTAEYGGGSAADAGGADAGADVAAVAAGNVDASQAGGASGGARVERLEQLFADVLAQGWLKEAQCTGMMKGMVGTVLSGKKARPWQGCCSLARRGSA